MTYLIGSLLLFWLTAVFYTSVMHFRIVRDSGVLDTLHWSSRGIAYLTLLVGLVLDFLLNVLVMSVVFVELPKELLTTSRIRRHKFGQSVWRKRVAVFFCNNYLSPFDAKHCE